MTAREKTGSPVVALLDRRRRDSLYRPPTENTTPNVMVLRQPAACGTRPGRIKNFPPG